MSAPTKVTGKRGVCHGTFVIERGLIDDLEKALAG